MRDGIEVAKEPPEVTSLLSGVVLMMALVSGAPTSAPSADALVRARASARGAHETVRVLAARRASMQSELDRLGTEIARLESQRVGPLNRGPLRADLRRSQALSSELGALSRQLATARSAEDASDRALLAALDARLAEARMHWAGAKTSEARRKAFAQISSIRSERDRVSARLPQADTPKLVTTGSEDPQTLRARADALLDEADRVRARLGQVRARIHELRAEADLQRRMSDFASDQSLFDEQDRRLRVVRTSSGGLEVDRGGATATASVPAPTSNPTTTATTTPVEQPTGATSPTPAIHGSDDRPRLGAPATLNGPPSDDLDALEQERQRLEQQVSQLEAKAQAARAAARAQ